MEEQKKEVQWKTIYGRLISVSEMSHQHLSNILWYYEVLISSRVKLHPMIGEEIKKRFGGIRLPYRPLIVFKEEMAELIRRGYTNGKIGSDVIVNGVCIGKVTDEAVANTVFTDVDGWKAVHVKEDAANSKKPSYWIYDSSGKYVAFLSQTGKLDIIEYQGDNHEGSSADIYQAKVSDMTFDPETQLIQAVRYAYLITQKPKQDASV